MSFSAFYRGCRRALKLCYPLMIVIGLSGAATAQDVPLARMDHSQMDHARMDHGAAAPTVAPKAGKSAKPRVAKISRPPADHARVGNGMAGHDIAGQNMDGHNMAGRAGGHAMKGFLGRYPMTREGSGTSWVPEATPHDGSHQQLGDWSLMTHGWFNLVYDRQDGPRGGNKKFVSGMLMAMAQRQFGDGTLGFRAMVSPEPLMGANGYPLLLATGETADGVHHLVDRQHPHDLFMELAATYSYTLTTTSSLFVYGGLPGEPALGPPAFMHRTSGVDNPEAPISHHWLDSTHITFGVVTAGAVINDWKFEASAFRGREPDQYRYDIERPSFDSFAGRVSWNPMRELSLQVSYGQLKSPEQLEPLQDENRVTASAIYTTPFGDGNLFSTTLAYGRKMLRPGDNLDAYLVESSAIFKNNWTAFMRAERVMENELTHDIPGLDGRIFTVSKVSVGGIYDFLRTDRAKFGVGALASRYVLPADLKGEYGRDLTSLMVFGRIKLL